MKNRNIQSSFDSTDVIELVRFCLNSNLYVFECFKDNFFGHYNCPPIGSPIYIKIADIVMQMIESKVDCMLKSKIFFWPRKKNYVYIITKQNYPVEILNHVNSVSQALQFAIVHEVDRELAFLGIIIERYEIKSSQETSTIIYREPIFSAQYLTFYSDNLVSHKVPVVKSLITKTKIYSCKLYFALSIGSD